MVPNTIHLKRHGRKVIKLIVLSALLNTAEIAALPPEDTKIESRRRGGKGQKGRRRGGNGLR